MKHLIKFLFAAFALAVAVSSCETNDPADDKIVTLIPDKTSITADGESTATFTVKYGEEDVTSSATISMNGTEITSNTFTTAETGTYKFSAEYDGKTSNDITITATGDGLVLSVDKPEIKANGADAAIFTVKYDREDVTSSATITMNGTEIDSNTFTTVEPGKYKFTAEYDGKTSNEITITATGGDKSGLVLSVDKPEITCDGDDAATLTVKYDGEDVTSSATIMMNGTAITGNTFTTTEADTYRFTAEYGGKTSAEIAVTAVERFVKIYFSGIDYYGDMEYGAENMNFLFTTMEPEGANIDNFSYLGLTVITEPLNKYPTIEIIDLPARTYNVSNTPGENTVVIGEYAFVQTFKNGVLGGKSLLTSGTMTIEGDHANYTVRFDFIHPGGRFMAEYVGPIKFPNPYYLPDYDNTLDFGTLSYISSAVHSPNSYGNYMVDSWLFNITTNANVEPGIEDGWLLNVQLNTLLNSGRSLPDGEYTISDKPHPSTARIGGFDNSGNRYGAWVIRAEGGKLISEKAYPLLSGTIKSTYSNGVLTFEIDARSTGGVQIVGTVMGNTSL